MIETLPNTEPYSRIVYVITKASNYVTSSLQARMSMTELVTWCDSFKEVTKKVIDTVTEENMDTAQMLWLDAIGKYISANPITVTSINDPLLTKRIISELEDDGYLAREFYDLGRLMLAVRNLLIPLHANYVFIKLETGGLSTYDYDTKILGAKDYPIFSITFAINNLPAETIIIHQDSAAIGTISKYAARVHGESGLIEESMDSEITLEDAVTYIRNEFRRHEVRQTNPQSNYHTILVAYGADFVTDFLRYQARSIFTYFSPKTIDVLRSTSGFLPMGVTDVFQPVLYSTGVSYIDGLRKYTLRNNLVKIGD